MIVEEQEGRIIDLDCIRHNIRTIRAAVPQSARLMAVVKADAYGHGAIQVAKAALEAGADFLAVALVGEGVALRKAGITSPVLVLGAACHDDGEIAAQHGLTLAVCDAAQIEKLSRINGQLDVHLKLDTGMGRIGARTADEITEILNTLRHCSNVHLAGAFTHFCDCDGDENGMQFTRQQLERFTALCDLLPDGVIRHCANSAAIHRLMPEAAFDMVRAGISMYGYPPVPTRMQLEQPMSWKTHVTFVKTIYEGDAVSYGRTFHAQRPTRIATIACGYGDGYHRACSGKAQVLIHGKRVPVVGRICMDQMMADVTSVPEVKAGDIVTLLGTDGNERITAEDLAAWAGTISYEVLLAATGRVQRHWCNESK